MFNKIGLASEKTGSELLLCGIDENILFEKNADDIKHLQERIKDNLDVKVRIICHRDQSAGLTFVQFEKRVVAVDVPLVPFIIYGGKVAFVILKYPMHVAIMYNDFLGKGYIEHFNYLWKTAKKD